MPSITPVPAFGELVKRVRIYRELRAGDAGARSAHHPVRAEAFFLGGEGNRGTTRRRLLFKTPLQRLGATAFAAGGLRVPLLLVSVSQKRVGFKIVGIGKYRLLQVRQGLIGPVLQGENAPQQQVAAEVFRVELGYLSQQFNRLVEGLQ